MLKCFKAYDIRGILEEEITQPLYKLVARAMVSVLKAKEVVIGYDARQSSPMLANFY